MRIGFQLPACAALLATAAAGIALARTRPSAPASRPCGATRPAAPLYSSVALVDACRERARAIGEKLDEAFKVVVRPPFVVAGNMPPDRLRETTNRSVVQPAQAAQGPADQARFLRAAAGQLRAGEILRDVHAAPRTVEEVLRLFPQSSRRPGRRREGRRARLRQEHRADRAGVHRLGKEAAVWLSAGALNLLIRWRRPGAVPLKR